MRTSVDLPAPFSPSSATIEPAPASRSTPWRTSTPPNDFLTPRARRSAFMTGSLVLVRPRPLLAGLRVDVPDVGRSDHAVRHVDVARLGLPVDHREERRDDRLAVVLREVPGVV